MVSSRERVRRKLQKEMRRRRPSQGGKSESQGDLAAGRLGSRQGVNTEANDSSEAHHHDRPRFSRELEKASTGGKNIHQIARSGSCQEVKAEADWDGDKHHLGQPDPCQEVIFEMVDEADTHHHGHRKADQSQPGECETESGPKSLAGRLKSSRNAMSHGLSIPLAADPPTLAQAYKLVEVMTPEGASPSQKVAAVEMAQAQTQLLRVAAVRRALLA